MYRNFTLFLSFFFSSFLLTHPFYKTMSEEAEHKYNQLKDAEKKIIDTFKEQYPKVPAHFWENLNAIEKQKQTWLSDTALKNSTIEEPHIKEFLSEEELIEYCNRYIEYECIQQGIDHKKIDLDKTTNLTIGNRHSPLHSEIYITPEGEQCYCIDSESKSIIVFNPTEFIKNRNKKLNLKMTIFYITEAWSEKKQLIQKFITYFYTPKELTSKTFSGLIKAYRNIQGDIHYNLAQLLNRETLNNDIEKEPLINNVSNINNKAEDNSTDSDHQKTLKKWLKRIIYLCNLPYDPFD